MSNDSRLFSCAKCSQDIHIINTAYLECHNCSKYVHISCLQDNLITSGIAGDVFFQYTCSACSVNGEDTILRDKITWFVAVVLAINDMDLKCSGISNQGYFHWRTHITGFIDRNWQVLFDPTFKRRKNWLGTIAGVLSHHSPSFFLSGSSELGENGWWKLAHALQPSVYMKLYNDVMLVRNRERAKMRNTGAASTVSDEDIVMQLLEEYGLKNHYNVFSKKVMSLKKQACDGVYAESESSSDEEDTFGNKRFHLDLEREVDDYQREFHEAMQNIHSYNTNPVMDEDENSFGHFEEFDMNIDESHVDSLLGSDDILNWSFNTDYSTSFDMSDDCSSTSTVSNNFVKLEDNTQGADEEELLPIKSLFNVRDKPRVQPWSDFVYDESTANKDFKPASVYQEHEMLKKLKKYLEIIDNNPNLLTKVDRAKLCEARRLHCKLKVRKLLRKQNREVFDLDRLVSGDKLPSAEVHVPVENTNVLDKFQVISSPTDVHTSFATRLTGSCIWSCFTSPYTKKTLQPFIRRDTETITPWIKLMNQLQMKINNQVLPRAPIDYCYVRPHHIAAINSLCEQFYWPGIDITDVLQYPDYTVVALYKKLVVGFGLLVPDADHNEAYISFLWTRPNWQRSGIGSFMLYHLIQTCIGKDITLHVSATNSALILYQKFGFKVEEFIQDFYDKYFPITSNECKHALFLRLSR